MLLKLSSAQKRLLWAFEKSILQVFANLWWTKLKAFFAKVRQSVQNYLNEDLVTVNFLENGFETTFSSKANVLSIWKEHFSIFYKFLRDEVETIFWGNEANCSKLSKSKFVCRKLPRKSFWGYLELKNECSDCLKRAFTDFC